MHTIDQLVFGNALEALAFRTSAEYWGAIIRTYYIGKGNDLVDLMGHGNDRAGIIIFHAHGDESGIILDELAPEIAAEQHINHRLTPDNINRYFQLNCREVICTACNSGTQEYARAFYEAGATDYVAPEGYPYGKATLLFLLNFIYEQIVRDMSISQSLVKANAQNDDSTKFMNVLHTE